jgi:hypothetical protein
MPTLTGAIGDVNVGVALESMRWPRGYVGTDHETLGSVFLSVLMALKSPEQVLGEDEVRRVKSLDPEAWYPVGSLLSLVDLLDRVVGTQGVLRMGRRRFEASHRNRVPYTSAHDVVYGIDEMYHHVNRGSSIGGWTVLAFEPGHAELEKTTPHHCAMEQGILSAALSSAQCPSVVSHKQCFREGADSCIYSVSSTLRDARWSGTHTPAVP